ncbi:hypothetical protein [Actinoallomurus soli]|uniref:hypothetical protein n=1 Tax=Actinoallomurus soli TaxID=2952535 RepID=UPI002092659D|nr:hypothetical protein [Actinoallomurus soli]MCO5974078.1 hypothetical protein [Actinoallomurus soli]
MVLATEALATRLLGHIIRLTGQSPAEEWKALRWPWIMRTLLAWAAGVAMAGYLHYTIRAYQLILFSIPTHVTGWLRDVFHTGWLVWPISVIAWAIWLTVALEAIRYSCWCWESPSISVPPSNRPVAS